MILLFYQTTGLPLASSFPFSFPHEIVNQLKPFGSPWDVISPSPFEVFDAVGNVFLIFINKCLESGSLPIG